MEARCNHEAGSSKTRKVVKTEGSQTRQIKKKRGPLKDPAQNYAGSKSNRKSWLVTPATPATVATAIAAIAAIATISTATATTTAVKATGTATTATTTAATLKTTAAAATTARSASFAGTCFVHRQRTAFHILSVEPTHRFLACSLCRHGHKSETTRFIRKLVENNLHFGDVTDLAEQVLQFAFRHRER